MGHGVNVIAELTADHRDVERLFGRTQALGPGDPKRNGLFDRLRDALSGRGR